MKIILFLALLGTLGCEENKTGSSPIEKSSQSDSEGSKAEQLLDDEDCDDKLAKIENKAEETMMNLQGGGDAGCAIE